MASRKMSTEGGEASTSVATFSAKAQLQPLVHECDDSWTWDTKQKSHEVQLSGPRQSIAHFHPQWSNGTAGVRGTRRLNGGRFYWEINLSNRIFGTSMMFGVGTQLARLHVYDFVNLLGENSHSWGLSHKGVLCHAGKRRQYTNPFRENTATTIGIYFDGLKGTLTYYKDGVSLGTAFEGITQGELGEEQLYPMVCSTAGKSEMALGVMKREFFSLQDRCRAIVLQHLTREEQIDELELPRCLKRFISEGLYD